MKIFFNRISVREIFNELLKKEALPVPQGFKISDDTDMGYFFNTFSQLDSQIPRDGISDDNKTLWDTPIIEWEAEPAGSDNHNNTLIGGAENHCIDERIFFGTENINGSVTWAFNDEKGEILWRTVRGNRITIRSYEDDYCIGTTIEVVSEKYNYAGMMSAKLIFDIMGKLSNIIGEIYERNG